MYGARRILLAISPHSLNRWCLLAVPVALGIDPACFLSPRLPQLRPAVSLFSMVSSNLVRVRNSGSAARSGFRFFDANLRQPRN